MPQRLNFTIVIYNDSLSKENLVHDAFTIVKERLSMFCNTVKGTLYVTTKRGLTVLHPPLDTTTATSMKTLPSKLRQR